MSQSKPGTECGNVADCQAPGSQRVVQSPFTIIVDTREQAPWSFDQLTLWQTAAEGGARIAVRTERGTLTSGDYSIAGMQDRIAIERKSLADLYGTLGKGRARFEAELERLSRLEWAAVIIESGWHGIARGPEAPTTMQPRSVAASILAFMQRMPSIAWLTAGSRDMAATLGFRLLERFFKDTRDGKRPPRSVQSAA